MARTVRRASGSNSTRSASRPTSMAPFDGRPNSLAGVVDRASTSRSADRRPAATPPSQAIVSSVSIPGPPFEMRSNDSRQLCFSTAARSGTWSVATSASAPSARPSHSASGLPAARSGGEIT